MQRSKTLILYGIDLSFRYTNERFEGILNYLDNLFSSISTNPYREKDFSPVFFKLDSPISQGIPKNSKLLSPEQSLLRIYLWESFIFLTFQKSILKIDFEKNEVIGNFELSAYKYPRMISHTFLLTAIVLLLHSQRFFYLHAAALEKNGHSCLLVGDSGSGKSTNTMQLIKCGWNYLSDDIVMLQQNEDNKLTIHSVPGDFKFKDDFVENFSSDNLKSQSFTIPHNEKKFVDIQNIYPKQYIQYCDPNIVIFPQIVNKPSSRLVPISNMEAFQGLIQQSPFIYVPHQCKQQHFEALKELTRQCNCYKLLAGKDLLNKYENLSTIIETEFSKKLQEDTIYGN